MRIRRIGWAAMLWATLVGLFGSTILAAPPVGLIFDTDMGNDVDDALALGLIHALESRGQCRLLAVTVTKDHPLAAPFVDVVNTFYGRGDIPIGMVRPGKTPEDSKYLILAEARDENVPRYPHALTSGRRAPEATLLLRHVLAQQADGSVVIAQVGFSTNLARLLESPADAASPFTGVELVQRKVRLLSVMAGAFTPIGNEERYREYNVVQDVSSAQSLVQNWPTPIVWSGFEIGIAVPYPATSIERDYNYVEHHPLAEAYRLYSPPPHNRPTWDLTAVLHAVLPEHDYFGVSAPGVVTVENDGYTAFRPQDDGPHRYLTLTPEQRIRTTEALVQLSSQPPQALR